MMNERIKKYIDPIVNFWSNLASKTKKIIFIVLGGVILLGVVLGLLMNRTQYTVLYPGLDHDEAVEVMTELKSRGVGYKEDNGTIYVPADKENSLRMDLSNEGHPKTAPNYDYFTNHVGVMTTDYEKKVIEKYQLNQRLEAVIKTLDPVSNAYVTISVPDESTYAWDNNSEKATASVTLKLKEGKSLDSKQVGGIKQLVAKSVPNLSADNVSVIDNQSGEEMSSSSQDGGSGSLQMDLTEFKLKIEQQYENNIENKIEKLLAPTYGEKNVSVSVKSQMDLDKKIQDIITYKPTTSDNKGIVSESQELHEQTASSPSSAGGVAGTQNNTDTSTTTYPGVSVNGNTITTKDSKSYKYLVSQVQEQIQSDAAALQDLTVSVMLNSASTMTDSQKQDLTKLVSNAAGVDPSKTAVVVNTLASSAQPVNAKPSGTLPVNMIVIIAGVSLFLLLGLLAVLLAVRKRRQRAEMLAAKLGQGGEVNLEGLNGVLPEGQEVPELEQGAEEENPEGEELREEEEELPQQSIESIRNSNSSKEDRVKKDLLDFSSKNPEIAAQLIRSWLRGEDENRG